MKLQTLFLTAVVLAALVVAASAQTTNIPRYTIIPVVLEDPLSSTESVVGQRFFSHCSTADCGGFPEGTRFVGVITQVTPRSGNTPGQIDVAFTQALLPGGVTIPISGRLTSLDPAAVRTDPETGRLIGTVETRDQRNKFIGYGAGAGLVIGIITGNTLRGTLLGAAAGWLYGATVGRERQARDVFVAQGTEFGIMLTEAVDLPARSGTGPGTTPPSPPTTPPPGAGPLVIDLTFTGPQRPFMEPGGAFMIPFRATMDQLGIPFRYNSSTRTAYISSTEGEVRHQSGTRLVHIDGRVEVLNSPSRIVGGTLYVPTGVISAITGKTVTWIPSTGVLRLS